MLMRHYFPSSHRFPNKNLEGRHVQVRFRDFRGTADGELGQHFGNSASVYNVNKEAAV